MSSEHTDGGQISSATGFTDLADRIRSANETLLDGAISLHLAENYDIKLLPKKSEHLREWWETDSKTKMHARFCLPLTMASGLGYYILSPATFSVSWSGSEADAAVVEIHERSSHANITAEGYPGTFTVNSSFVARTKNIGDYVYVKGIANFRGKPYSIMESMMEAWWDPSEISVIGLLNRAGQFTIKKGEPLAQMFVLNHEQTEYALDGVKAMAPLYEEWLVRQEIKEKNLDYFRGRLPNQTPVCPHFRDWSSAQIKSETMEQLSLEDILAAVSEAKEQDNPDEGLRQLDAALRIALTQNVVSEPVLSKLREHVRAVEDNETRTRMYVSCYKLGEVLAATGQKAVLAELLTDIGSEYKAIEHFTRAADYLNRSLQMKKEIGANQLSIAHTAFELGAVYDYQQNFDEAEKLLDEALTIYKELCEPDNEQLVFVKNLLANLYSHRGDFEQAESLYAEVLEQRRRMHVKDAVQVVYPLRDLVSHFREKGDLSKAIEHQAEIISIFGKNEDEQSRLELADGLEFMFWLNRDNSNFAAARLELLKALAIREEILGRNSDVTRNTNRLMGDICTELGEQQIAAQYYGAAENG